MKRLSCLYVLQNLSLEPFTIIDLKYHRVFGIFAVANHCNGNQQAQQNLNGASFWFNRFWKNLSDSTLTFTLLGHMVSTFLCTGITTDALSHCLSCWSLSMAVEDHPVVPSSLGQQRAVQVEALSLPCCPQNVWWLLLPMATACCTALGCRNHCHTPWARH